MKIIKIIQSVLAAFIGVQKIKNLEEDNQSIEKFGLFPYIVVGLILCFLFLFSIYSFVNLILE
ncbi:MAG: DUF2970 domain-containing protein [Nitrosomonadales bacterium]